MIKILFICHGNICRSTMCESVFMYLAQQKGLSDHFEIASAATSREEIGNPVHVGTRTKLQQMNIPVIEHYARQLTKADGEYYDYLIGMDNANIRNMKRMLPSSYHHKIYPLLAFTKRGGSIADPWYTGNFDDTYYDVMEGCNSLLSKLTKENL